MFFLFQGAEGRNKYLSVLKELGEKYKRKLWGWVWTASGMHGNLESALGIGGFGYPAMAVVNVRKKVGSLPFFLVVKLATPTHLKSAPPVLLCVIVFSFHEKKKISQEIVEQKV